jgi:CheY-like chemotaxis protein
VALSVLVIDDDPGLQETLEAILELEGYRVTVAHDGVDALEKIQASRPAVIVLDLMMPRMNGTRFVEELRQRGLRDQMAIIVLTADGQAMLKATQIGAESILTKPFEIEALLGEINRLTQAMPE